MFSGAAIELLLRLPNVVTVPSTSWGYVARKDPRCWCRPAPCRHWRRPAARSCATHHVVL